MASFKLHNSSITATVSASAKISASTNTTATITVTATGSIPSGYNVYSTGVVAAITINGSSSGNKTIFGNASGWYYGSNGAKSITYSVTVNKSTAAQNISWSVAFKNAIDGTIIATKHTATGTVSVPAKPSYTIAYNANGGSGAPSSQTKWYGTALTLSSTKPTRTGYSFQGWATSASGAVAYASGASYTANAGATLYAVWKANTYTVSYNANGGTGAPGSQQKTYGVALTLSSTKPTRTNYNFLGWATSASATAASYAAGASYTVNATVTLYAVWELAYTKPRIFNLIVSRCDADGVEDDAGNFARIKFDYVCDRAIDTTRFSLLTGDGEIVLTEDVMDGDYGGSIDHFVNYRSFNPDSTYTFAVTVADTMGSTTVTTSMSGSVFPIDAKVGGDGVSFGKPAELGAADSLGGAGVADFGYDAKFNEPVYGKALGMDRLPAIPTNSDFNNYMEPGCYAVQSNAIAETIANIPVARAGRLEVWSATGEGVRLEQWSYLRQRFIPYNSSNAVWERELTRGENNVWNYYNWWKSSLTPAASEKVYSKAAMTISLSANTTLGVVNTYTKIPLDKVVLSTSERLTLSSNSIRIGSNIQYIKVSGQALVKCSSVAGNRHARIQKLSGGTTTSIAWDCVYGAANSNTEFPFTPIIVPVSEGDLIFMVYYTGESTDQNASGSTGNGWQTYLTVEEL